MTEPPDALGLEAESLDRELHELLMQRADLAARERALRGATAPIRPAREAAILRTAARHHQGAMPFVSMVRILREVLTSTSPAEVYMLMPEDASAFTEMARAHFGALATLHRAGAALSVMERVRTGAVGLMPSPGASIEKWWTRLTIDGAPKVVARLPAFDPSPNDAGVARGFVMASVPCELSGEDRTLLVIEASTDASPSGVERALVAEGLKVQLLDRASERGIGLHLFEAEGFLTSADIKVRTAPIEAINIIGAYPVPLAWTQAAPPDNVVTMPARPGSST